MRGAKASQRFVVLGTYADGLERDVTAQSSFLLSNVSTADVDSTGRVVARADGTVLLKAEGLGRTATANIRTEDSQTMRPFGFARDIVGDIFTRRGCNGSACHGGVKGRGGLKLSLEGTDAREDYRWIIEGGTYQVLAPEPKAPIKPRVDTHAPEKSLLLVKPTFTVPHGGGKRFSVGSQDYQTLLNWIRNGAFYGDDITQAEARIVRIEAIPAEAVLQPQGKRQILVTAHLANGMTEDITGRVRFESSSPEVIKVSSDGLVEAAGKGEAAVQIASGGQYAIARFGVITELVKNFPEVPPRNLIDQHVFSKLRRFHLLPSELSSDAEFLRRVCLDMTGTLPPPRRIHEFLASRDPRKRDALIDALLGSPEFVDYWTFRFSDLYQVGPKRRAPRTHAYWEWVRDSIAANKPYNEMARERIAAEGYDGPSSHYLLTLKILPVERMVSEQMRVFLGRRLDCAQCHNHPFDAAWTQDIFWSLAAFYGQVTSTGSTSDQVVYEDPEGNELDLGAMGKSTLLFSKVIHPRRRQEAEVRFFTGEYLPQQARNKMRTVLANWMTSHPYFAEATVNRMWGYFFGRGIVDPVDDFRVSNPPTHPALLKELARDFEEHGYDLRHLIRLIVQSRTYQVSSTPNRLNREDLINYSHALPRPLDAEVLLDAISDATGVPEVFEHISGGLAPPGTRAINLKSASAYPSHFLDLYGRPLRDSLPERDGKASLAQALHMLVGSSYATKLGASGSRIARLLQGNATDKSIVEELYLATVSRLPSEEESVQLAKMIRARSSRKEAFENLLWGLISSREFAYNH
jgi:hypothetical protein